MIITEGDRLHYKLAIVRLGQRQYQVAIAAGLHESKLSAFLSGRVELKPEQIQRLQSVLGLDEVVDA